MARRPIVDDPRVATMNVEFEVDDETVLLAPGDSLHFRTDRPHRWRNPGRRPARAM